MNLSRGDQYGPNLGMATTSSTEMHPYFFQHPSFPDLLRRSLAALAILFLALLLPKIFLASKERRVATYGVILACCAAVFRSHRIQSQIAAYLMGFLAIWTVIWSAVLVLIKDPALEFKRIQKQGEKYVWESFPEEFGWRRVCWVLDLMLNPRGVGWAHRRRLSGLPLPILELYSSLESIGNPKDQIVDEKASKPEISPTKAAFLIHYALLFLLDWTLVEIATHGMTLDSFLSGTTPFSSTLDWLGMLPYRLAVAAMGCYGIIDLSFVSLGLVGVGLLGEGVLGTWGETWCYPRHWGSLVGCWERGVAGFWGTWWHDLFTYGFVTFAHALIPSTASTPKATSDSKITKENGHRNVKENGTGRKKRQDDIPHALRFHLIFALSGLMHLGGSYIQSLPTIPFHTFLTFFLQSIGIFFQGLLLSLLLRAGFGKDSTSTRAVVFVFSAIWGVASFPFLVTDMARGGLFRTKFLPISLTGLWWGNRWPGWFAS